MLKHQQVNPEIELLSHGLKFTPTPAQNLPELEKDVKDFCRKLRLREHFYNENNDTDDDDHNHNPEDLVANKSNFNPKRNKNILLDTCIDTITKTACELSSLPVKNVKNNSTKSNKKALIDLQNDPNIIIKEADKGGAVCIMDRAYYGNKIKEMLQDENTYSEIEQNKIKSTMSKIKKLIKQHDQSLTDKERDYLTNFKIKVSDLYGLPKVHKSDEIKSAVQQSKSSYVQVQSPADLKFRPIVAGPVCPTSRLSHLVDILLKPIPQYTRSYVRDDIDFLTKFQRQLDQDKKFKLVTFDVESLYTNIDHDLGKKAIKYWIDKHRDKIPSRFSAKFICEAIEIILENNVFHFDDKFFIQLKGTAMGTKMAPNYASLVLAYLEEMLYTKLESEKGIEYAKFIKEHFVRYLDDCFIVWNEAQGDIKYFHTLLNNLHPSLNFTLESSETEIPFLDILVKLNNNQVTTDIYYKPTDTHQYLSYNSCHPRHTKNNIPYSQARRICTIIDDPCEKNEKLQQMYDFFIDRGYPPELIKNGITKAKAIPQSELRKVKETVVEDIIPFVQRHNPRHPNVFKLLHSTFDILQTDQYMKKVLTNTKLIKSQRQPQNLKHLLTRARFTSNNSNVETGSKKCGDPRCGTCPYMLETKTINIKRTGEEFTIKSLMNCKSTNVLYLMTCNGCHENYVGLTTTSLAARHRVHRQQIQHPYLRQIGASEHFDKCNPNKKIKYNVAPFFKINNKTMGEIKESLFIKRFQPFLNKLTLST
jgi:hypothetical protein